jgi:3-isopropylmalate dehydrogenase
MNRSTLKVAVIGGDGTGPEVAAEGLKVLKAVCQSEGIGLETADYDLGGDRYLKRARSYPKAS